ncbi:hypothetical protein ZWY2020_004855 [Hordeum vulgare]|nr:hypothetical protein ZWY2020_004855 [Hordeum vulgare]
MLDSQAPWLAEGSIQIWSGAGRQGRRGSTVGRNATAMAGGSGSGAGGWGSGGARIGVAHLRACGTVLGGLREEEGAGSPSEARRLSGEVQQCSVRPVWAM